MSAFDDLAAEMEDLAGAPARAAAKAAPKLLEVVKAQHAAGQAPDGTAWPPTVGGRVALTDLTQRTTARAKGASVVLTFDDALLPHQVGSDRLPRRQVVPDPGDMLPDTWEKPLKAAIEAELGRAP